MRPLICVAVLAAACGPKAPPPAPEVVVAEPAAPLPPPPPPVPEAPPEPESNADFRIAIDMADGSSVSGRVVRVERGVDFYGADGFTDRDIKTTVGLSGASGARDVRWDELSDVTIDYSDNPSDISCTYDSSVTPWAYICTLPSTTQATTTDGATMEVSTRNVWRLTFDDGNTHELYLSKLPVREADSSSAGMRNTENPDMYVQLRDAVMVSAGTAPVRIRINP